MNKSPDFRNTLMEALGMKILPMKNGKYYASMPVDHRTVQIQGCLHGGASIALAETLAGSTSTGSSFDIVFAPVVSFCLSFNYF